MVTTDDASHQTGDGADLRCDVLAVLRAIAATSLGFEDVAVTQESLAERTRQVAKGYADFGASRVDFFFMTITKESPGIVDILDVRAENSRGHVDWHVA